MNDTVIQVENLSKRYRLGVVGTGTLSHDLNRWWAKLRGRPDPTIKVGQASAGSRQLPVGSDRPPSTGATVSDPRSPTSDYMWALKHVSFEVRRGEILGIIGRNGAGKSTVLKILSRVTAPTSGEVRVRGRIASLLEVGTGFHPELTGRENIFLNGAILGMRKAETARKFDEIVAFSGVEQYIDTPVKRYSSGMYVRLAFAVAAHLDPEILIVDEVLAVGDAEFQRKCLGRMNSVAHEGRTVLLVSHNMNAIANLCGSAIWFDQGLLREAGPASEIVSSYLAAGASGQGSIDLSSDGPHKSDEVQIVRVRREPEGELTNASETKVIVTLHFSRPLHCGFSFYVYREGSLAFVSADYHAPLMLKPVEPGTTVEVALSIPPYLLNPGFHSFGFAVTDFNGNRAQFASVHEVLPCDVRDDQHRRQGRYLLGWGGSVSPLLPLSVSRIDPNCELSED